MKKYLYIFIVLFTSNAYGSELYTDNISNSCTVMALYAVFEPNEYTCDNGYFLPANTAGCQPCPNSAICNGGTFYFNEQESQGIVYNASISETAIKSCAVNFSHDLIAIFEPNKINLNYDDGYGLPTALTCDYGGTITLPETPTRPGYTFNGWRVKKE